MNEAVTDEALVQLADENSDWHHDPLAIETIAEMARELIARRRADATPAPQDQQAEAVEFDKASLARVSSYARDMQHCDDPDMYQDGQTILDMIRLAHHAAQTEGDRPATPAPADVLREAIQDAIETLALCEAPAIPDPAHHAEVKALGRRIGFGALMSTASAGWRETLSEKRYPPGGEFVSGPCHATVVGTLARLRAALGGRHD